MSSLQIYTTTPGRPRLSRNKSNHVGYHCMFPLENLSSFAYPNYASSSSTTSFNITNFNDSTSLITCAGKAMINNGTILLNPSINSEVGQVIYAQPLQLKDSRTGHVADFSTRFSFTISYMSNEITYGDGFAFYMAPLGYKIPPGSAGGGLGLFNSTTLSGTVPQNHIVCVEFDTFVNDYCDPPMRHVGINNNSVVSLAYSRFDIDSNLGKIGHAIITYNASTKILAVSWFFNGSGFMPNNSLSHQIDLGEILPEWVNVGFSGSTGSSNEENIIHSWEFTSTLNSTDLDVNKENNSSSSYRFELKVIVIAVTCCVFFVLVVAFISWLRNRTTEDAFDLGRACITRRFEYNELVAATNGFEDDRKLGEGGSGEVYKGFLSDLGGRVVAVKRIFSDVENSERVFTNEVKIISRLIHRNLVQFIGWCHEQGELLLVFEYMPNGSLDTHLFGNKRNLTWRVRYKIALGVARAIRYLHEEAEQCVLHRDIKSSNVLLDTDFNTKLCDFGTAKLVDPRLRTQRTQVVGTYGYLAPEYVNGGRASKESDIYSFGVVALKIAGGRRSYQDGEDNYVPLMNFVWKHYVEGNILKAADKGLNMDYDVNEMICLLTVGLWCTRPDHAKRPKVEEVIIVLKQQAPLPVLSM